MARIGPVIFSVSGDFFLDKGRGGRINAIVWVGATTPADRAELRCLETHAVLWKGIAGDVNTYQGAALGESGIHAPNGFVASRLDSGELLIYLRED